MNRDSTPSQTEIEYRQVISYCKALFDKKNKDYGTSWRILRLPSLTDQIFIKAQRIRSIQEKGAQKLRMASRENSLALSITASSL
jgi:hypothetical protein